ncbi:hypothetical protein [Staphylococcus simulans]|uniref:hypothetical protein n=1 Tax=Staphylococcus simulans TaxID=1286 RepID=UPI000D1D2790|nr:hypothetical protein [Staphylococcus simulans]PTJ14043.1 hypothetical protein BU040_00090 [Staphylococcus simulans]PTJ32889.1 hypothetical protein BU027_10295 [Staphylococcus simulans]PTJ42137.1 hypothetical protein BU022_08600 [Staphylococcus simulans]RIN57086.1 hypothetical protein BU052_08800 [Staphylococcus simulans]RIN58521.1 hypothetical protein BU033_04080 [Staphylococcus simulans]
MADDNKYLAKHEFEAAKNKIYERINDNDRKHTEAINTLEKTVNRQISLQERSFESQERSEKHLEKLSGTMERLGDEVIDIKYKVKSHDDTLHNVQSVISEKQKGNTQISVAIISGVVAVIVAAFGFAQVFF